MNLLELEPIDAEFEIICDQLSLITQKYIDSMREETTECGTLINLEV